MTDAPSREEVLKQQKANCIFCKIVSGDVPSKKVYEDEKMLAILDINPATKGHTLVMTKEHYPIMPIIPPNEFEHLFGTTATLSGAIREGVLAQRCTIFIANGGVAGQQSPHFLFHIIPREDGDGLEMLDPPSGEVPQEGVGELIRQNLKAIMQQHLTKSGHTDLILQEESKVQTKERTTSKVISPVAGIPDEEHTPPKNEEAENGEEMNQGRQVDQNQLSTIIEQNPELKALLINNPKKLEQILNENPEFKQIFQGIDVKKLGEELKRVHLKEGSGGKRVKIDTKEGSKKSDEGDGLKPAREMTMQELFDFIDSRKNLRDLIINDPKGLKKLIPKNERLRIFFEGTNINAVIQAYQEHAKSTQGVTVTMEPEDENNENKDNGNVRTFPGPSKEEQEDAWEEVREPRANLSKISRLFK